MDNFAARAGRWSAAHWKTAVFGWLAFVVAAFVVGNLVGTRQLAGADTGSGQSGTADRILARAGFDDHAGESVIVQHPTARAADPAFRAVVGDVAARLAKLANVQRVQSPLGPGGQALVSRDGHSALVRFEVAGDPDAASGKVAPMLAEVAALERGHPGFTIRELGSASAGYELDRTLGEDFKRAERLSLPITLAILVVAFGTLVAASVPVALAFSAVLATLGLSALLSHVVPASDSTSTIVLMIGMAVGVDYSLFYLRREREEAAAGRDRRAALATAAATSGQAVLVSGATVMIAMAGMLLAGNKVFVSIGVATTLVVLVAVIGSLTVLPALLGKLGHRVDKGRVPFLGRSRRQGEGRLWAAILRPVLARPLLSAVAATAVLVGLTVPAFGLHTELPSFTDLPSELPIVQSYERIQAAFPGASVPAVVVVEAADVTTPEARAAIDELHRQAIATGRMAEPVEVEVNPAGTVAAVRIPLAGTGSDRASLDALEALRERVVPATVGRLPSAQAAVTGETAGSKDFNDAMRARAPVVFAFVLGLAFLLLLVAFRSIVVPLKAILLNLLSVGASYGILVAVFQYGWGDWLVGAHANGAIASWLPLFLFVILFGLSMDYHVFILSRVRELVDRGMPTTEAVDRGIRTTAGTVTSAAIVMVAVFGIFATLRTIDVKQAGVGLAVAVLLDATIIRGVLLPATMAVLGEWNWYLPRWLGWLPRHGWTGGRPQPDTAIPGVVPEPART